MVAALDAIAPPRGKKILRQIIGKGGNESRGLLILLILQILTPMA
jgi:hypothetical protein